MKPYRIIHLSITLILISLFAYASAYKWLDFEAFQTNMIDQPIPIWLALMVSWLLPLVEATTAALLSFRNTRFLGYNIALTLIMLFTVYVILAVQGWFGAIPCACVGLLSSMDWLAHLRLNLFLMALLILGILVGNKVKTSTGKKESIQPVQGAG